MSASAQTTPAPWRAIVHIPPAWIYTLRVLLAIALAMYTAYWLELDSPASAGTTVLVVMNASRGAIISKSIWRVAGSIVGATAAVVLIAWFAQAPVLFVVGLAAWIGLCTFIASLLRYNRGYGAVLAGYTVTLVAFGAIADPDRIFQLATARVAVVTIGVLATAIVFLLTDTGPGQRALETRVAKLIASAAATLHGALTTGDLATAATARRSLAADLLAIDQVVEFAAVEDAGLGRYKADLRLAFAELFAALTGGLHSMSLLRATPDAALVADTLSQIVTGRPALRQTIQATTSHLQDNAAVCEDIPALAALNQTIALLQRFDTALASLQALQDGKPRATPITLRHYVNPVTAGRNGLRAAIAILIAGLFWIVSQWPDGGAMLTLLGPVTALASQAESAAAASVDFLIGTFFAVTVGGLCSYAILPQITGFPLLMAAMLPIIGVGILISQKPGYAFKGLGFLVFFVTAVAPGNPMHFDLAASLNTYVAFVIGAACAVLAFRILLPPNPVAEGQVLFRALRDDVQRLARRRRLPPVLVWEHLQHQKLVRLSRRLASLPAQQTAAVRGGVAAITISRHLATLRRAQQDPALPGETQAAARRVADSFRHLLAAPDRTLAITRAEAASIDPAARHLRAALHDLVETLAAHTDVFARTAP
jgi:uncharacterized membrane protein YccC